METPDGITQADLTAPRVRPVDRGAYLRTQLRLGALARASAACGQARNLRQAAERGLDRGDVDSAAFCLSMGAASLLTAYREIGQAWGLPT